MGILCALSLAINPLNVLICTIINTYMYYYLAGWSMRNTVAEFYQADGIAGYRHSRHGFMVVEVFE